MTEQCKIYLDPWDKANLEGTAMLIGRMPDLDDRVYRGITCQRWFVRFLPDQDIIFRWLDYGDAEPYAYPHLAPHSFTLGRYMLIINQASPALSFLYLSNVLAEWYAGHHTSGFLIRQASWLVGYSIVYSISNITGAPNLTYLSLRADDAALVSFSLGNSTTAGGPWEQSWTWASPYAIPAFSVLTAGFSGPQPAGASVQFDNTILTMLVATQT